MRQASGSNEKSNMDAKVATLMMEVENLKHRLAALDKGVPRDVLPKPFVRRVKPRARMTVARLAIGGVLAVFVAVPVVYGSAIALLISPEGNVGIGKTDPNFKLNVDGNMKVDGDMKVAEGNVGIGKTDPNFKLNVDGKMKVDGDMKVDGYLNAKMKGLVAQEYVYSDSLTVQGKANAGEITVFRTALINGNVGIGKLSDDKLNVDGRVHVKSLQDDGGAAIGNAKDEIWLNGPVKIGLAKYSVPASSEVVSMIRGVINRSGAIQSGTGFTVKKEKDGLYDIKFDKKFQDTPAVMVNVAAALLPWDVDRNADQIDSRDNAVVINLGAEHVLVKTGVANGNYANYNFSFIAIGKCSTPGFIGGC